MLKNSLYITSSKLLDQLCSSTKFTSKTTLDQIDFLNRYRSRRSFYRYGAYSIMDNIVEDQPNLTLTFDKLTWGGKLCNPISFRFHSNDVGFLIRYPVKDQGYTAADLNDISLSVIPWDPHGEQTAERPVREFMRYGVRSQWGSNEEYNKLFMQMRGQYENAWLDLKRRKVAELKASLDSDSVNEFVAAKRAEHTQAIMDIAIAVGTLTAKLETYRNRIGSVNTAYEAEKMFSEVEMAFRSFNYVQERNAKRLNKNVKIPGGKKVKVLTEKKEE